MLKLLSRWFNVYEKEASLFFWMAALSFLYSSSIVVLNNYTETAFLLRFGVEYLPTVRIVNSIAGIFIVFLMASLLSKTTSARIMSWMFVIFGLTIATFRYLIPTGISLIYPSLYILKLQYESLLLLLFLNMANDLFNIRQSKRLWPTISAGGVVGSIIFSFATPDIADLLSNDDLLIVFLLISIVCALIVKRMRTIFPTLLISRPGQRKKEKPHSFVQTMKTIGPLIKESTLIKVLVCLTLIPNIVLVIMNYQFNYVVSEVYSNESDLLTFLSNLRGVLNIFNLGILLFLSNRITGRWGLPVALMVHPANYLLSFFLFFYLFEQMSAAFAYLTTSIFRKAINTPARVVLMTLLSKAQRAIIMPFLRLFVARMGIFIGAIIILYSDYFFSPRYLSLIAIPLVIIWISAVFVLKKKYSKILIKRISKNLLDLKSMEKENVVELFKDSSVRNQLMKTFREAEAKDCLWYGKLIKSLDLEGLDENILKILRVHNVHTQKGLIELLSPKAGTDGIGILK